MVLEREKAREMGSDLGDVGERQEARGMVGGGGGVWIVRPAVTGGEVRRERIDCWSGQWAEKEWLVRESAASEYRNQSPAGLVKPTASGDPFRRGWTGARHVRVKGAHTPRCLAHKLRPRPVRGWPADPTR